MVARPAATPCADGAVVPSEPWPWQSYFDSMPAAAQAALRRLRTRQAPLGVVEKVIDAVGRKKFNPEFVSRGKAAVFADDLRELGRALVY